MRCVAKFHRHRRTATDLFRRRAPSRSRPSSCDPCRRRAAGSSRWASPVRSSQGRRLSGCAAGFLVAVAAAAGVRLAFGTSAGRPGLAAVAAAVRELGVAASGLTAADDQPAGVFAVHARDSNGRELLIKVYGRDAYDSQLVAKLWRTLWYQDAGPPRFASAGAKPPSTKRS